MNNSVKIAVQNQENILIRDEINLESKNLIHVTWFPNIPNNFSYANIPKVWLLIVQFKDKHKLKILYFKQIICK